MSKLDQIRALREARHKEHVSRPKQPIIPKAVIEEFEDTTPSVSVGVPSTPEQQKKNAAKRAQRGRPRKTEEGFDKATWQREYMRKRRAEGKS